MKVSQSRHLLHRLARRTICKINLLTSETRFSALWGLTAFVDCELNITQNYRLESKSNR